MSSRDGVTAQAEDRYAVTEPRGCESAATAQQFSFFLILSIDKIFLFHKSEHHCLKTQTTDVDLDAV